MPSRDSDLRFARRVGIVLIMTLLAIGALALVTFAFHFLLVVFGGVLLAVLLNGAAAQISQRTPLPYRLALILVVLVLIGLGVGFWSIVGPPIIEQAGELQVRIPEALEALEGWLLGFGIGEMLVAEAPGAEEVFGGVMGHVTGIFTTAFEVVFYSLIVIFIGLYGAARPQVYHDNAIHLVPPRHQERAKEVLSSVAKALRHWFLGQFIAMLAVGILTTVGLMIIGVPLALSLGLIAGVLEFVPYLGPIVAFFPIVLVALLEGPEMALYAGIFFTGVQQLESYVITPLAQQFAVSMPPALLIVGQVFFGLMGGIVGVILATPLLVAVVVVVQLVYVHDVVGDEVTPLGEEPP
jgi:predicted PurR-regulated permease PerM